MAETWVYKYKENQIVVKNAHSCEELYVNETLQDIQKGLAFRSNLTGKLPSGEEIKVSIGGMWKVECFLFIDNVLQNPINIKSFDK